MGLGRESKEGVLWLSSGAQLYTQGCSYLFTFQLFFAGFPFPPPLLGAHLWALVTSFPRLHLLDYTLVAEGVQAFHLVRGGWREGRGERGDGQEDRRGGGGGSMGVGEAVREGMSQRKVLVYFGNVG